MKTAAKIIVMLASWLITAGFTLNGGTHIYGWSTETLTFLVNPTDCGITEEELTGAIDRALAIWNDVPTSRIKLVRGGTVTTTATQAYAGSAGAGPASPVIICDTDLSNTIQTDTSQIPAVASPDATDATIDYGFVLLNAESGKSANIAKLPDGILEIILAHEIGHVLGLGHTSDKNSLMYFNATYKRSLRLSQDDMDGLTYLYPREETGAGKAFGCASTAITGAGPSSGGSGPAAAAETAVLMFIFAAASWIFRRTPHITIF